MRIWSAPDATHWPAIAYRGERRNLAFRIPIPPNRELDRAAGIERSDGGYHNPFGWGPGDSGTVSWGDGEQLDLTLPNDAAIQRTSGLLPLPTGAGTHTITLSIGNGTAAFQVIIADVRRPWPITGLRDGFPVDAAGRAVVLLAERPGSRAGSSVGCLRGTPPRDGRALLVGDPLAALGRSPWDVVDADQRPAEDLRYPHHAVLVALADLPDPLPRTICWSPGNQILYAGADPAEEVRVLGALRAQLRARGSMPDLVLALPPLPLEDDLREAATARIANLRQAAVHAGWRIVDLAAAAGDPVTATAISAGLHTRYPTGQALDAVAAALDAAIER